MLPADLLDVKTYEQTAGSVWVVLVSKDDKCDSMLTKSHQYGGPSDAVAVDFSGHTYFSYINHKHLTQLLAHIIPPPLSSPLVMII